VVRYSYNDNEHELPCAAMPCMFLRKMFPCRSLPGKIWTLKRIGERERESRMLIDGLTRWLAIQVQWPMLWFYQGEAQIHARLST
jgi:hypothetical protein